MACDEDLGRVPAPGGVERVEADVVDDQEIDGEASSQRLVIGVVEPGRREGLEETIRREGENGWHWQQASQPSVCANTVLPTPSGATRTTEAYAARKRRLTSACQSARSEGTMAVGSHYSGVIAGTSCAAGARSVTARLSRRSTSSPRTRGRKPWAVPVNGARE